MLLRRPKSADDSLRVEVLAGDPPADLCNTSAWLNSTALACQLLPSAPPPLELRLVGPGGLALAGPWQLPYEEPQIGEVSPKTLPISGAVRPPASPRAARTGMEGMVRCKLMELPLGP